MGTCDKTYAEKCGYLAKWSKRLNSLIEKNRSKNNFPEINIDCYERVLFPFTSQNIFVYYYSCVALFQEISNYEIGYGLINKLFQN